MRAEPFEAKGEDRRIHDGEEEAGRNDGVGSRHAGTGDGECHEQDVGRGVEGEELAGVDVLHQWGRDEAADSQHHKRRGEVEGGGALRDGCVLLHVGDEIAPHADLGTHVADVCKHRKPELRVVYECGEAALIFAAGTGVGIAADDGELHDEEDNGEEKHHGAEREIDRDDAHDLAVQVGGVGASYFHGCDFTGLVFHAGEDELAADDDSENGAGRG